MKKFAIIFDLNGTLVDTEVAYFYAYRDVLSDYNIPFTIEDFTLYWSKQGKKLSDYLRDIHRENILVKEKDLLRKKDHIFQNTLGQRVLLLPGTKETLKKLKKANFILGLDSSTSKTNIDKILNIFKLEGIFNSITSGDMQLDEIKYGDKKKKSSRLKALADMLGYHAPKCVVIGDAYKDIEGAKSVGMKAVAVPNQYTKEDDFSLADKTVSSLKQVTPKFLAELFI